MEKNLLIVFVITLVLVVGVLIVSATLPEQSVQQEQEEVTFVVNDVAEPGCGFDTCQGNCAGDCGIKTCGCGRG